MRIPRPRKREPDRGDPVAETGIQPLEYGKEDPRVVLIANQDEGQQLPIILDTGEVPAVSNAAADGSKRLVATAGLIGIGQLVASTLGFIRIEILNILFYGVASGPFVVALQPIQMVSDLLIGGSVSGALIPTFTDHSEPNQRAGLTRAEDC